VKKLSFRRSITISVLISLITMFSGNTVHSAERPNEFVDWPITESSGDRTPALLKFADKDSIQFQVKSGLHSGILGSDPGKSKGYQCQSPFDQRCIDERKLVSSAERWKSVNQMPICTSPLQAASCIERVEIAETDGKIYSLKKSGYVPGFEWPENKTFGSPSGSLAQLWKTPNDKEDSGYTLYSQITVQGSYKSNQTEVVDFSTKFLRYQMTPLVDPYVIANQRSFCKWTTETKDGLMCAREKFLDPKALIAITYHLPKDLTGWFSARMSDAKVTIQSIDEKFNSVTISANPTEVPVFAATIPCVKGWVPCGAGVLSGFNEVPSMYLESLQQKLNDRAILEIPSWEIRSANKSRYEGCEIPREGFAGFIFSNATFATSYPPKFESDVLKYEMGALHLKSDGSVFKGNFDMLIESSFARCLWGLSKAPVQASIAVTSKDGNQNIATTSLGERNGFIRMKAAGFTFSISTVEMKLQNKKVETTKCIRTSTKKTFTVTGKNCPKGSAKTSP